MGRMDYSARRKAEGEPLKYFIEDPGTGTLYKRGQLLGKVNTSVSLQLKNMIQGGVDLPSTLRIANVLCRDRSSS